MAPRNVPNVRHMDTPAAGNVPGKASGQGGKRPQPTMPNVAHQAPPAAGPIPPKSSHAPTKNAGRTSGHLPTMRHQDTPTAGAVPDGESGMYRAMADHADKMHPRKR